MICVLALFTFSVLGIFSANYRSLSKEAFRCVFQRVTFKKCETKLDQKIKSKITSKLLKKNPIIAKFVYKRFEVISWIFTLLLLGSMLYSVYGLYNLVMYGTCNPISGNCPLDIGSPTC